jgi:hypothetical protein
LISKPVISSPKNQLQQSQKEFKKAFLGQIGAYTTKNSGLNKLWTNDKSIFPTSTTNKNLKSQRLGINGNKTK